MSLKSTTEARSTGTLKAAKSSSTPPAVIPGKNGILIKKTHFSNCFSLDGKTGLFGLMFCAPGFFLGPVLA